jgi:hypothetical protein
MRFDDTLLTPMKSTSCCTIPRTMNRLDKIDRDVAGRSSLRHAVPRRLQRSQVREFVPEASPIRQLAGPLQGSQSKKSCSSKSWSINPDVISSIEKKPIPSIQFSALPSTLSGILNDCEMTVVSGSRVDVRN